MFKVSNKGYQIDANGVVLVSLLLTLTTFHTFFYSLSIVNFEHVIASWVNIYYLTDIGKLLSSTSWGVLCQLVHPKPNKRHFRSFSSFQSALSFFLKTCFRERKKNFKITFAPFLGSLAVSRPSLVNSYSTDFGACSANQCNQNKI